MKHAGQTALDRLEPLLGRLRKRTLLTERKRGLFYRGGRAFLHFHEDGDAFFADMRVGDDFDRFPATTPREQTALLKALDTELSADLKRRI